jgi:hypothetical protein
MEKLIKSTYRNSQPAEHIAPRASISLSLAYLFQFFYNIYHANNNNNRGNYQKQALRAPQANQNNSIEKSLI